MARRETANSLLHFLSADRVVSAWRGRNDVERYGKHCHCSTMTPTCHIGSILLAQATGLEFLEPVFRWAETLALPDYIALGAVGVLAFIIGTAISRSKSRSNRNGDGAPSTVPVTSNGSSRKDSSAPQDMPPEEPSESNEEKEIHAPLIVFRSNDPDLWGKDVYRGTNSRACEMRVTPDWANWISISRVDTGEVIFAPTWTVGFSNNDFHSPTGFNASHELFYGARHLGMFSETVPNEVETRFTYGGWGFGHRVSEDGDESESAQASGWAGKEISAETVFEIVLHQKLPEGAKADQVLQAAETALSI